MVSLGTPYDRGDNLIALANKAQGYNNGQIGAWNTGIVSLTGNSSFENTSTGVMFVGINAANAQAQLDSNLLGYGHGIRLTDSTAVNNGIINVSIDNRSNGLQSYGVQLLGNSNFENNTLMILGAGSTNWIGQGYGITTANTNNQVTNNGEIYIGRAAQVDLSASPGIDIANSSLGMASGVQIAGKNQTVTNNGTITIGNYIQNASAIKSLEASQSKTTNAGTINLNGGFKDGDPSYNPLVSYGMFIRNNGAYNKDSNFAVNTGSININGVNNIGMYIGGNGNIISSGAININGNSSYDSLGNMQNRNYGIQVNGSAATGNLSGTLSIQGSGAVGGYVLAGGTLTVAQDTDVSLSKGNNQIGFILSDSGSKINSSLTNFAIGTDNSTGFYIINGASFTDTNALGNPLNFDITGNNAKGIIAQNKGSTVTSSNTTYNISATDAHAIEIRGGATGTINNSTDINLNGVGSIAAVVDGASYDIFNRYLNAAGTVVTDASSAYKDGTTTLTSSATLNSSANDATGYKVVNSGNLVLTQDSSITLNGANNTGVYVDGANLTDTDTASTLNNAGNITTNGVGIRVSGGKTAVNNTGEITASNGTAAILVENGASLTLGGSGTSSTSTGNIIAQGSADGVLIYGDASNPSNNAVLAQENSGLITVEGEGAGIRFTKSDGSARTDDFDISQSQGLTINVEGANGHGIIANTSGQVSTGANVNINDTNGGSALEITGGATTVNQSGKLISQSTTSPVVSTTGTVNNFTNTGTIQAVDTSHDAVNLTLAGATFTNDDQSANGGTAGIISGKVNIAGDNSNVNLNGNSQATDIIATGQNNTFTLNDVAASNTNIFNSLTGGTTESNTLALNNSSYTYNNTASINNFNQLQLNNNSLFTLNQGITLGTANNISIDATSTLAVAPTTQGNFDLANNLTGTGKVTVNNGGIFNLTGNTTSFAGNVIINDAQFTLSDQNTTNLTNATLTAATGSTTTVGEGTQNIGGFVFDGGTVAFTVTPGQSSADTTIHANTLDISGTGNVELSVNAYNNAAQSVNGSLNLLEQDDQNILTQLATGDTVTGAGGNLTLTDSDGNTITNGVTTDIEQNSQKVAEATYDYRLTGQDTGLYVNYGLTQLNLIGTGANALELAQNTGATGNAADMSAKITGAGDLAITASGGTISLSNTNNDYTGNTTVNSGNLRADADNALGATTGVTLANNTGLQLNAHQQTINGDLTANTGSSINLTAVTGTSSGTAGNLTVNGETSLLGSTVTIGTNNILTAQNTLSSDQDSTINIAGGTLNLNNGATSQGTLLGSGAINVNGNTLNVQGGNSNLTATTNINSATANINNITGLGSGVINFTGTASTLNINSADGSLKNNLAGDGLANINDSNVILAGDNTGFSSNSTFNVDGTSQLTATEAKNLGSAEVNLATDGILNLNTNTDWTLANTVTGTGELNKLGTGVTTITSNNVNVNNTNIQQGTINLNNGVLTSAQTTIASGANLIGDGSSSVIGNIDNEGNIYVGNAYANSSSTTSTTFEINGDLNSSGNVYLSNFNDTTASAFVGNTLKVNGNLNGDSNYYLQTQVEALEGDLIDVTGSINGNNTLFVKDSGKDPIGTEQLKVVQSGLAGTGSFALNGSTVDIGAFKYGLQKTGNDWYLQRADTINGGGGQASILSKGANAAVGMHSATASMWEQELGTLMTRMGDLRLDNNYNGGVWVRQMSQDIHASPSSSRAYQQQYNGTLVGVDKAFAFDGGKFYLGVMTGLSRSTLDFKESSNGSIKSQTYGLYGTTLFDNGFYLDTVLKYGHMKNKMDYYSNAGQKIKADYSTDAFGASIEGGKRFSLNDTWFIEPQLQMTASRLKGDSYRFNNDLEVKSHSMQLFNGRAGVVAGAKYKLDNVILEPYVEFSHTQEFSGSGRVTVNNNRLSSDQIGTRQHYGAGVNFNVAKQHNFFINASYENGDKMEQPWGIKAGYQFRF